VPVELPVPRSRKSRNACIVTHRHQLWKCLTFFIDLHTGIMTDHAAQDGQSLHRTVSESPRGTEEIATDPPLQSPNVGGTKIDAEKTEKQQKTEPAQRPGPPSSIRSRTSRRSRTEDGSENTSEEPVSDEKAVREQVEEEGLIRRTPLYRSPIPGQDERWHAEVDTPSQWTSLFYGTSYIAGHG
jgi:hypothetical protein